MLQHGLRLNHSGKKLLDYKYSAGRIELYTKKICRDSSPVEP